MVNIPPKQTHCCKMRWNFFPLVGKVAFPVSNFLGVSSTVMTMLFLSSKLSSSGTQAVLI